MSRFKTRDIILTALVAAGFLAFYLWREKLDLTTTEGWLFSILAGVVIVVAAGMFAYDKLVTNPVEVGSTEVPQPAISRFLFHDTRAAALWLVVRLYVGLAWLEGGIHKIADPKGAWDFGNGSGILGYWKGAVAIPAQGTPKINEEYAWYRSFLQMLIDNEAHAWFAPLIAWGELLVGVGLIVGGLVGIAAFFGALMNMSFMLAGSASTNPVLFFLAVLLMLGWQVAGYYGADRFILPIIGAPWRPGKLFKHRGSPVPVPAS
jgi:thiosulfate dehydrogenase [quinone] large subunit